MKQILANMNVGLKLYVERFRFCRRGWNYCTVNIPWFCQQPPKICRLHMQQQKR